MGINKIRIIELQSRHLSSFILLIFFYLPTIFLTTFLRRPFDLGLLFFTYLVPVIPLTMLFDGLVSSLRTRTTEEILALLYGQERARNWRPEQTLRFARQQWLSGVPTTRDAVVNGDDDDDEGYCWEFQQGWRMHTWPLGWANWLVGVKTTNNRNSQ